MKNIQNTSKLTKNMTMKLIKCLFVNPCLFLPKSRSLYVSYTISSGCTLYCPITLQIVSRSCTAKCCNKGCLILHYTVVHLYLQSS